MVAKDGRVATPINAGLRPPPPAAYGVDSACHPAADCHQEVDGKVRPVRLQMSCRKISLRHLCADPDRRSHLARGVFGFSRSSGYIKQILRGDAKLTPEQIALAKELRMRKFSDADWRSRLLAGDAVAKRELTVISAALVAGENLSR